MSTWRDCVVVLIDLVGTKKKAVQGNKDGSKLMRDFHRTITGHMKTCPEPLDHVYVWNDSALVLSYVDRGRRTYDDAIDATSRLKRRVDAVVPCYAIAIKGQAFPWNGDSDGERVNIIRASSYALANCFSVEREARKSRRRSDWYIDSRIAAQSKRFRSSECISVAMLPTGKVRKVFLHEGYFDSNDQTFGPVGMGRINLERVAK